MRYSSTTSIVLALCAINEAFGGPTHSHLHQKFHQKRELKNVNWNALDWDGMGIDWAKAYSDGHSPSVPASGVASVPEAASSQSTDVAVKAESAPIIQPSSNTPSGIDAQEVPNQDSELTDDSKKGDKSKPHDPKSPDKKKPDHDSPDKDKPDHDSPDKKKPDHDSPDKDKPDHDSPDKKKPDHDSPDKDKPDHDSPDKKKPDHDSPDKKKPDSKHDSSAKLWKNLVGASNNRKVFGMSTPTYGKEVGYVSNVGIPEGSNMIKVESADDHTFTNQFINISEEPMTVVIWNKAASPGLQDPMNANPNLGASIAPEHPALTLALQPKESQTVAFLDESVIGWAQACETRAMSGGFQTTWGEAQFNTTGSGYDVSAIQNAQGSNYIMHITSVEASSCESSESKNMWITDTSTVGSGSCYIAQNTAHLITKMGGYAS